MALSGDSWTVYFVLPPVLVCPGLPEAILLLGKLVIKLLRENRLLFSFTEEGRLGNDASA